MQSIETTEDIQQWVSQFPTGYSRLWVVLDNSRKVYEDAKAAIAQDYTIQETYDYQQSSKVMLLVPRD